MKPPARIGFLSFCLIAWLLPVMDRTFADDKVITRPMGENGAPTKVYVAMALLDVDSISSSDQSITANLFVLARWKDPRLADPERGKRMIPLIEIWNPRLQFVNQQKIWKTFPDVAVVSADGTVEYTQRVWGPFSQPLDMQNFPFDTQTFELRLAAARTSPTEVQFLPDPDIRSGLAPRFSLPDWKIMEWKLDFTPYAPLGPGRSTASFALVLKTKRHISYYIWKIMLPLLLIVAMSWIDPTQSSTQISVATTSMLTLIAYRFMIGGTMPPVPYMTRIDYFIMGSTILVFLALIQSVLTSVMANREKLKAAQWLDRCCRILFPATFTAIAYFSFIAKR